MNTSQKNPVDREKDRKMTEAKISVTFTQKVSEQAYETADYSLTIERTVPEVTMEAEAHALFEMAKSEVLKQAGQEFDLSDTGVVMRKLKSDVSQPASSAPSAPAPAPTSSQQSGPTAKSVAATTTTASTSRWSHHRQSIQETTQSSR